MPENFQYDVFLSHSSKDKAIVRPLAERLRKDGIRVWFDEWALKPGDNLPKKIDDALEESRVLVLCMSSQASSSEWARLESGTFRFRDPLNKDRRFIPLRLDESPIKGSLAQFVYVSWLEADRKREYTKLVEACRPPTSQSAADAASSDQTIVEGKFLWLDKKSMWTYAFSGDTSQALSGGGDSAIRIWDLKTGRCLQVFDGHAGQVRSLAWSVDQRRALSGCADSTLRLWDTESAKCLQVMTGHTRRVNSVALSANYALSGSFDHTVRLWDLESGRKLRVFNGHTDCVRAVALSSDGRCAISGSQDRTLRAWDMDTGRCLRVLEGHTQAVYCVKLSTDRRSALSGSEDNTVRLWEVETGRCLLILEGHTSTTTCVALRADQRYALSGSRDQTVRLWDLETGTCVCILAGHTDTVVSVAWSDDQKMALSGAWGGGVRIWDLSGLLTDVQTPEAALQALPLMPSQVQYTNAKVLLVGDSGAGKTGLSKRLALNEWQPSDSTVGAWATQWKLPVTSSDGVEREIWLWDFGGQADQRLIHQLYMEDTALAVLVFDGQREDLLETLAQWDRDLTRASRKPFTKLLAAGRVDAGGLRVGRTHVEAFRKERGFLSFWETSAKANLGCKELKEAIINGIQWHDIPWRSSPRLFKRLKEEILRFKDEGRVLIRFNELQTALHLRLGGEGETFKEEEIRAVVGLLAGPGVVWELEFGSWILLQPERINAYAQAVIQTLRADEHERGAISEERVLAGDLAYHSSMQRLNGDEERFVLLAMHQTLIQRGLCMREHTDKGPLLIFPSYYRRERPDLIGHPAVLVSYRFSGFLDDIYATLVVRLHHTKPFQQDQLWRYAADFKTLTGKKLGVKLVRRAEGVGELQVYFDSAIPVEEKIIFSRYIHEHLLQKGLDMVRLRHYVCPYCGTPVGNPEVAMRRLNA
jgi:small GTP-binding protein